MPSASELERLMQDDKEDAAPLLLTRVIGWKYDLRRERLAERIAIWIARRLPRRVVLWAMIRVAAEATTGRWSNESPDTLDYQKMHDRWEYR